MTEEQRNLRIEVGRDNPGQIVVGARNVVSQNIGARPPAVDAARWEELRRALTALESGVADQVPLADQAEASKRVAELAEASTHERPDVHVMSSVWSWFLHHAPSLMGAVATVVFHPVVGALIQIAGNALTEEFQRQFGRPPGA